ncbi:MAG TPA: DUF4398 domain-containing protein [Polyangiaceae bacterium]|nr:DUF4398 domain-containing protein [Polyangiaceae bacterium]
MLGRAISVLVVGSFVACASQGQAPSVTDAHSAISAAQAVGAEREPKAALHLKLARDQTAQAEAKIRSGDNHEAKLLLDQAKVDAELALVLTREAAARAQAEQALQKVQQLQQNQ